MMTDPYSVVPHDRLLGLPHTDRLFMEAERYAQRRHS